MHRNNRCTRSGECESNSAPRFDNLKLLKARFINLAQKNFEILNLNRGASPKTFHASPNKKSYGKPGIKSSWALQKTWIESWLVQPRTSLNARWSNNQGFLAKLNLTINIEQKNDNKIKINRDTCYYIQNLNYHSNPSD